MGTKLCRNPHSLCGDRRIFNSGGEVILNKGSVKDAVLATIGLPGIFPVQTINDWNLMDGGVEPVPVTVACSSPNLLVVAVVLNDRLISRFKHITCLFRVSSRVPLLVKARNGFLWRNRWISSCARWMLPPVCGASALVGGLNSGNSSARNVHINLWIVIAEEIAQLGEQALKKPPELKRKTVGCQSQPSRFRSH